LIAPFTSGTFSCSIQRTILQAAVHLHWKEQEFQGTPVRRSNAQEHDLADKMYGAWLGRCAGCALGKLVENMGIHGAKPSWRVIMRYLTAISPDHFNLPGPRRLVVKRIRWLSQFMAWCESKIVIEAP